MTFIHSPPLMPPKPPCSAMAAPVRPAMSEWLWLVGRPNAHAATPHTMIATIAAMSAMMAAWLSPPKSTMWKMVLATPEDTSVITRRPKKLQIAAMMMAGVGFMQRVETTVAMALGASVAPLTMMTPILSRVTTNNKGLDASSVMNMPHSITTTSPSTRLKVDVQFIVKRL